MILLESRGQLVRVLTYYDCVIALCQVQSTRPLLPRRDLLGERDVHDTSHDRGGATEPDPVQLSGHAHAVLPVRCELATDYPVWRRWGQQRRAGRRWALHQPTIPQCAGASSSCVQIAFGMHRSCVSVLLVSHVLFVSRGMPSHEWIWLRALTALREAKS